MRKLSIPIIEENREILLEHDPPIETIVVSMHELDAFLRIARAAKEYRVALHRIAGAIKAGRGAEYLVDADICGKVLDEALSAFDFTDDPPAHEPASALRPR